MYFGFNCTCLQISLARESYFMMVDLNDQNCVQINVIYVSRSHHLTDIWLMYWFFYHVNMKTVMFWFHCFAYAISSQGISFINLTNIAPHAPEYFIWMHGIWYIRLLCIYSAHANIRYDELCWYNWSAITNNCIWFDRFLLSGAMLVTYTWVIAEHCVVEISN